MNYCDFLNKQIINKNGDTGVVLSFDKDHIVVKYPFGEKTYSSEVTFKVGFLTFKNKNLQRLIDQELINQEEATKKKEEEISENHKKYLLKRKRVNLTYARLCKKYNMLLFLFGRDFIYPPLEEFEKKYKHFIDRRIRFGYPTSYSFDGSIEYHWYYYN